MYACFKVRLLGTALCPVSSNVPFSYLCTTVEAQKRVSPSHIGSAAFVIVRVLVMSYVIQIFWLKTIRLIEPGILMGRT